MGLSTTHLIIFLVIIVLVFGTKKLKKKNLDMLVANDLNEPGAGFAHDTNRVVILTPDTVKNANAGEDGSKIHAEPQPLMDKRDLAAVILGRLARMRQERLAD